MTMETLSILHANLKKISNLDSLHILHIVPILPSKKKSKPFKSYFETAKIQQIEFSSLTKHNIYVLNIHNEHQLWQINLLITWKKRKALFPRNMCTDRCIGITETILSDAPTWFGL
jgi:hypothetical protein